MNNVSESIIAASNSPISQRWGVLNRNGVFYATVPMLGEDSLVEIALHGVSSEFDAQQALAALGLVPARVGVN